MELGDQLLDDWFKVNAPAGCHGLSKIDGAALLLQYEKAASDLYLSVHTEVTKAAASVGGGVLTDHGPEHVRTVIRRATELLSGDAARVTPYEAYLLLMAIHVHDIGNAYGRSGHELAAGKAMDWLGRAAGSNAIEKRAILRIARAHGGHVRGDQDTISDLDRSTRLLGREVRLRFLAALLRFADELADERQRASAFLLETGAIPDESLIYHKYAYALHSVTIDHCSASVALDYDLENSDVIVPCSRGGSSSRYLLDYIFDRTMKMHAERMYCMRFLRPYVAIDAIEVRIDVYRETGLEPFEKIGFKLSEFGYPQVTCDIYGICPTLDRYPAWEHERVTGATLAARVRHGSGANE